MQVYKYNGWRILSFISENEGNIFFDHISKNKYKPLKILKDNHRSKVILFEFENIPYILKIPIAKNKNRWIRFTTLYRSGESLRGLKSLHTLQELGIPTADPIMVAEKMYFGMVVDSWMIYKYIEGDNCLNKTDLYDDVVTALESLHQKKYLHGDPQIRNFILSPDKKIHLIDVKVRRTGLFSFYSKNYEWAYLARSTDNIEAHFPNKNNLWYKIAKKSDKIFIDFVPKKRKFLNAIKNIFRT